MYKQWIVFVVLTLLAVLGLTYVSHGLSYLYHAHQWVNDQLNQVFAGSRIGKIIQDMITLALVPVLIGAIVALAYWIVKRTLIPHFMTIVWVSWVVMLTTIALKA